MADPQYHTKQYTSEEFVECCGAVLFHLSEKKVCLVHDHLKDEWLPLAKGHRNEGDTRHQAALHEIMDQTGYLTELLPVTMKSRAPEAGDVAGSRDSPRQHISTTEPFMLTQRKLPGERNVELIWWYIACINEERGIDKILPHEQRRNVGWFSYQEVFEWLTFETDKELIFRAIELVEMTYSSLYDLD